MLLIRNSVAISYRKINTFEESINFSIILFNTVPLELCLFFEEKYEEN
jgi:hypothetical protein